MSERQYSEENSSANTISIAFKIAVAAVFAALVAVATLLFVVPIPATSGYFNLGETLIYIAALLLGPFVGAVAGAGASIADVLTAPQYAPGTFTIKAIEGFLVGFLNKQLSKKIKSAALCAVISIVIGGFEMVLGYFLYEQIVLGYPFALVILEVPFNIAQMLIGLIVAVPIVLGVRQVFPQLKS